MPSVFKFKKQDDRKANIKLKRHANAKKRAKYEHKSNESKANTCTPMSLDDPATLTPMVLDNPIDDTSSTIENPIEGSSKDLETPIDNVSMALDNPIESYFMNENLIGDAPIALENRN